MKKRILSVLLSAAMIFSMSACVRSYQEATTGKNENFANGYFTVITSWGVRYYIVYANDTKVKYFVAVDGYHFGITPLYNEDGTLQIYKEGE